MPRYLFQASYTADALAAFVSKPQDRVAGVRALDARFGGTLESIDFALGEYDVVLIATFPDDTSLVAAVLAGAASGAFRNWKTTKLLTPEEFLAAQQQAHGTSYQAPIRA